MVSFGCRSCAQVGQRQSSHYRNELLFTNLGDLVILAKFVWDCFFRICLKFVQEFVLISRSWCRCTGVWDLELAHYYRKLETKVCFSKQTFVISSSWFVSSGLGGSGGGSGGGGGGGSLVVVAVAVV